MAVRSRRRNGAPSRSVSRPQARHSVHLRSRLSICHWRTRENSVPDLWANRAHRGRRDAVSRQSNGMEVVFGAMMISIGKTTFMRAACRREAAVERVIVLAAVGLVRYAGFPCGLIFGGQRRLLCPSVGFRRVPLNANASRPTSLRLHVGVFGVIKRVRRRRQCQCRSHHDCTDRIARTSPQEPQRPPLLSNGRASHHVVKTCVVVCAIYAMGNTSGGDDLDSNTHAA